MPVAHLLDGEFAQLAQVGGAWARPHSTIRASGLNCVPRLGMHCRGGAANNLLHLPDTRAGLIPHISHIKRGGLGSGLLLSRLEPTDSNSEGGRAGHSLAIEYMPTPRSSISRGSISRGGALDESRLQDLRL